MPKSGPRPTAAELRGILDEKNGLFCATFARTFVRQAFPGRHQAALAAAVAKHEALQLRLNPNMHLFCGTDLRKATIKELLAWLEGDDEVQMHLGTLPATATIDGAEGAAAEAPKPVAASKTGTAVAKIKLIYPPAEWDSVLYEAISRSKAKSHKKWTAGALRKLVRAAFLVSMSTTRSHAEPRRCALFLKARHLAYMMCFATNGPQLCSRLQLG